MDKRVTPMMAMRRVIFGLIGLLALVPLAQLTDRASAQIFGNRNAAETQMQIDQLQQQVRLLTGQVEQLNYQVQTLQDQLRRFQEDAEFRFQQLEGGAVERGGSLLLSPAAGNTASAASGNPGPGNIGSGNIGSGDATLYPERSSPDVLSQAATGLDLTLDSLPAPPPPPPGAVISGEPLPGVEIGASGSALNMPAGGQGALPPSQPGGASGGPIDLRTLSNGAIDPMTGQPYHVLPQSHESVESEPDGESVLRDASVTLEQEQSVEGENILIAEQHIASDPNQLYSLAYGLMMRGDYPKAEEGFGAFLDAFPDHPLAIDARYWLGESYLSRGLYEEAANSFLNVYQSDPANAKAPTSLLKLAQAMDGLGESAVACATLRDVIMKYPDAPRAAENAKVELLRAQC